MADADPLETQRDVTPPVISELTAEGFDDPGGIDFRIDREEQISCDANLPAAGRVTAADRTGGGAPERDVA
ncbi:hypothetical protein GCM10011610_12820 [Nocardia rhizosphaerihabitans]|uniref:Uncharacterized protein n=1 Tax=Nocardia rhizosphaerihabitans TaxID=1691570 RepID=A0ABQ2K670_9NOCA|nr:hypothetical protein GCM10011610_12820 [Nocardia rhizosphaerihabitans]